VTAIYEHGRGEELIAHGPTGTATFELVGHSHSPVSIC
jgi:hypothetical protein